MVKSHYKAYSLILAACVAGAISSSAAPTNTASALLPAKLEELSSPKFLQALEKSERTCVIPFGIMEKHGPHLPLGTDLIQVREMCVRATAKEYAIVFPDYYFGQINEAKHQPGTIAYSHEVTWKLLQETLDELARNGVRKIVIVNGHGGNNDFLKYFNMVQLERKRNYSLYVVDPWSADIYNAIQPKMKSTIPGGHADESETSMVMAIRPDLVRPEEGKAESGEDQKRITNFGNISTPVDWYASFPNHYSGQGWNASTNLGNEELDLHAKLIAEALKKIKADKVVPSLQKQFYKDAAAPAEGRQKP